jgi:hypothetical protein
MRLKITILMLLLVLTIPILKAQQTPVLAPASGHVVKTLYLPSPSSPGEMQDLQNAFRTIVELVRISPLPSQNAIVVRGTPEQITQAEKILADMDQARPRVATYRLDFLLTEFESGKKVNARSYQLVVHSNGTREAARVGSRVPIVTGGTGSPAPLQQIQYMDIGVNIDCKLEGPEDNLVLGGNVEVSGITAPAGGDATHGNPVVRQSRVSFSSGVTAGKQTTIANLDEVDGPRRMQIDVTATKVK